MNIHTAEWGDIDSSLVKRVKCPKCGMITIGRLSGDNQKVEIVDHGKTIELECKGRWYTIHT